MRQIFTALTLLCLCIQSFANPITNYPYGESFESGLGDWINVTGDDLNWTRYSGGTPSFDTGPNSASEGNYYVYIESSGSGTGYPNKTAILESPDFDLSQVSNAILSFQYHMHGSTMGTLTLEISTNGGSSWSSLWSASGDQDNYWRAATIDLASYVGSTIKLRYHGQTGSNFTSDMAVDNIKVTTNIGGEPSFTCSATISSFPYTESFESGWGQWTEEISSNIWRRNSGGTTSNGTGPSGGAMGSTFYMYTEASSPNYPDKDAVLLSPCFDLSQQSQASFSFSYHMYGEDMGSLRLQVATEAAPSWKTIWARSDDQENQWFDTSVSLDDFTGQKIKLRFFGVTGDNYTSDMAIDELELSSTPATYPTGCNQLIANFPYHEGFEAGWGGWNEVTSTGIWVRQNGPTPSSETGPYSAQEGSYYVFTEASYSHNGNNSYNNLGLLEGPCFNLSNASSALFTFFYHMYADEEEQEMGTLKVEVSTNQGANWAPVWSKSGNQGYQWHQAQISLNDYVGQTIKLRFYGLTGSGFRSDMAVDNLNFYADANVVGDLSAYVHFPMTSTCADSTEQLCCEEMTAVGTVPNVGVEILPETTGTPTQLITNSGGTYTGTIPSGRTEFTPFVQSSDWNNGVSLSDVINVSQHVNNIQHIACPLRRIAADVDIDQADADLIQQLNLGTITSFSNVPNWRFIPKAYIMKNDIHPDERGLADLLNPARMDDQGNEYPFKATLRTSQAKYVYAGGSDSWMEQLDWIYDANLNCDAFDYSFFIVKSGDVSGDANYGSFPNPITGQPFQSTPATNQNPVVRAANTSNQNLIELRSKPEKNKKYEVSIVAETEDFVEGYQLAIAFDNEIINMVQIKPNNKELKQNEGKNFSRNSKSGRNNLIKTVWLNDYKSNNRGLKFKDKTDAKNKNGMLLFSFEIRSREDLNTVRQAIRIDHSEMTAQFLHRKGEIQEVDLQVFVEPTK